MTQVQNPTNEKQLSDVLIDKLIINMLRGHEGYSAKEYPCSQKHRTIGFGHNLNAKPLDLKQPITLAIAEKILKEDFYAAYEEAEKYKFFSKLNRVQKGAIVSMIFNMGNTSFSKFKKMISYLEDGDFKKAAKESLRSTWAKQVGTRAKELAVLIETGDYEKIPVNPIQGIGASVNSNLASEANKIKEYLGEAK